MALTSSTSILREMNKRPGNQPLTLRHPVAVVGRLAVKEFEHYCNLIKAEGGSVTIQNKTKGFFETTYYGLVFKGEIRTLRPLVEMFAEAERDAA